MSYSLPSNWCRELIPQGVRRSEGKADHTLSSSAEVKNA
jgi:hypothetical protein